MITNPLKRHSFAKQYLDARRIDIEIDGKQILKYSGLPNYPLHKITSSIEVGDSLTSDSMVIEITYTELLRLGFCVLTYVPKVMWNPSQRSAYKITRYREGMPHYGRIPDSGSGGKHFVLYSPMQKALQMVGPKAGPSSYGPIINIDEIKKEIAAKRKKPVRNINKYFINNSNEENDISAFDNQMKKRITGMDFGPKFVEIPEIPVIFSVETNEVVCIPIGDDIPKIGCVGKTGAGKTYGMHQILDFIKWKTNHEIAILNDNSNQTFMWTLPNQSGIQIKYLEKIGAEARPLPIIPLYPSSDDMDKQDMLLKNELSQSVSMSFRDVVDNFDYFFKGRDSWKLGASDKWFRQCKDQIMEATSLDEIENDILIKQIGHIKGLKPTIGKIMAIFRDLMDLNFTDISSGIPSTWKFKYNMEGTETEENPVIGTMRTGCIPSLITTNLGRKEYFPNYMRYYLDSIYDGQIGRNQPAWICLDEVGSIYKKGNQKTVAHESFTKCCTEGRIRQLGVLYTIQNYTKLDEEVRNNTNYLLSCIYSDSKEINLISKDFDLNNKRKSELSKLRNHEVIAMSNDKPFVIYSFDGERREETGVAYKGFTIPCLSEHRRPGADL